jgi:hypothetical protein
MLEIIKRLLGFGSLRRIAYRIYTKRMKDGKNVVRVEDQEYADALIRKLYSDSHLIDPEKFRVKKCVG